MEELILMLSIHLTPIKVFIFSAFVMFSIWFGINHHIMEIFSSLKPFIFWSLFERYDLWKPWTDNNYHHVARLTDWIVSVAIHRNRRERGHCHQLKPKHFCYWILSYWFIYSFSSHGFLEAFKNHLTLW